LKKHTFGKYIITLQLSLMEILKNGKEDGK